MKTAIVIPARYKSSRFPGKPLAQILGIPMVVRVANICSYVLGKKNVFVATDDKRIAQTVKKYGFNFIMTKKSLTGTDRVAEAAKILKRNIIINVQGDEPLIKVIDIKKVLKAKTRYFDHVICGYCNLRKEERPENINIPKVIINKKNELIYMSRAPVPGTKNNKKKLKSKDYLKQVCIYAFNSDELKKFSSFKKKSEIEKREDIEILRFFETNTKIKMVKTSGSSVAVDIPNDIKKVEKLLSKK